MTHPPATCTCASLPIGFKPRNCRWAERCREREARAKALREMARRYRDEFSARAFIEKEKSDVG